MDTLRILENLGLTPNESKIYLKLLTLGESLASKIAKETQINRSQIYRELETLQQKGLISSVIKENRAYFSATNPNNLSKIIEEKQQDFEEVLPELLSIHTKPQNETKIEVYSEIKGIKTVLREQLENVNEILIMGAGEEFAEMTEYFYHQYYKKRIDKKIKQKVLFKFTSIERAKKVSELEFSEAKLLDKTYVVPMATVVYGNKTALFSWPDKKVIVIDSINLTEGFREQFEIFWKSAKRIS